MIRQLFNNIFSRDEKMSAQLKNVYYEMLKRKLYPAPDDEVSYQGQAFLLCNSCFWCASILYDDVRAFRTCPICTNYELEFMPISTDENYKFMYDKRHGLP